MSILAMRKGTLASLAAAAGVAAAGWAAQRVIAGRVRRQPDADAGRVLETPIYVDHRLDSHDAGTIYVVENGAGPPIVLSHGVTVSARTWFHQLELLPKDGFRAIAYDHRGHGESVLGEAGHSLDNLADDVRSVPGARLELMDGGGHMLMLERSEALNQLIEDFAREVGAAR